MQNITHPTHPKLANNTISFPTNSTSLFNYTYPFTSFVFTERVELKLRLVADLGWEVLVARYVEVCPAEDFVVFDALSGFHVPQDADVFCEFGH